MSDVEIPEGLIDDVVADGADSFVDISSEIEDLRQGAVVLEGLHELATSVIANKTISQEQFQFLKSSATFMARSMDVPVKDMFPALESYNEQTIAMEGIFDAISRTWKAVRTKTSIILDQITGAMNGNKLLAKQFRREIAEFGNAIRGDQPVSFTAYLGNKQIGPHGAVSGKDDFLKAFNADTVTLTEFTQNSSKNVGAFANSYRKALGTHLSPEKYKANVISQYNSLRDGLMMKMASTAGLRKQRHENYMAYLSTPLLGGRIIQVNVPDLQLKGTEYQRGELREAISDCDLYYWRNQKLLKGNNEKGTTRFEGFSKQDAQQLIKNAEALTDAVANLQSSGLQTMMQWKAVFAPGGAASPENIFDDGYDSDNFWGEARGGLVGMLSTSIMLQNRINDLLATIYVGGSRVLIEHYNVAKNVLRQAAKAQR